MLSLHSTLNFLPIFQVRNAHSELIRCPWPFFHSFLFLRRQLSIKKSFQRSASCSSQKHNSKWVSFHLILCPLVERHMTYARTLSVGVSITHMMDFILFLSNLYTSVRDSGNPILWPLLHLFLSVIWLQCGKVAWNFSLHSYSFNSYEISSSPAERTYMDLFRRSYSTHRSAFSFFHYLNWVFRMKYESKLVGITKCSEMVIRYTRARRKCIAGARKLAHLLHC